VLEQLRLLTNLETNERKLLQIILLGQPELAEMLARPELRQLAQRVIARFHLGPLAKHEVASYVQHRLGISGAQRPLFSLSLMGMLYRLSGGIPRIINVLCDRALLGTYVQNREKVDGATLKQAAREVFHTAQPRSLMRPLLVGLLLAGTALAAVRYLPDEPAPPPPIVAEKTGAPKLVEVLPDVLDWPATQPLARSRELAYAALLKTWGTDFVGADYREGDECKQAEVNGLRCYAARGWLDDLRRLGMPAVLLMHDAQGREFDAALTGISDKSATFSIGGENRKVALGVLAQQWSGHYTLLWRMPPVASKKVRLGDYGPDVEWLAKQFAQLDGKESETTGAPLFDAAMEHRVKQFQLEHGLVPDGRVGPQTMMHLSVATDQTMPKLFRDQEKK
jgi:general secretion pathway protein A